MPDAGLLVMVTGANGFVGSHVAEALLAAGYRVRCMVRRTSNPRFIQRLPVELAYADLQTGDGLLTACFGVDAVCHCAGLTRAPDRATFMRVNAQGTETLAQVCAEANPSLRRFLFVSSQAAVGPSPDEGSFADESEAPHPITWYGESKWAAEQSLLRMGNKLPVTIVRPSAVLGPRDRDFLSYFELVKLRLAVQLGKRERQVSLIYIHDLVRLLVLALESDIAVGQTYFGCGQATSYSELSNAIARALHKRPLHITLPEALLTPLAMGATVAERLTGRPALLNGQRAIDLRQPYWLCSGEKARQELGFTARYDLETAVRETAEWYVQNRWL